MYIAAMSDMQFLSDFLEPISLAYLSEDEGYKSGQLGRSVKVYEEEIPDISDIDLVIIGCGEERGLGMGRPFSDAPNQIRKTFYKMYYWHQDVTIADLGNIKPGSSLSDTYAALKMVISELTDAGKIVLILGGAHDLTLSQYHSYAAKEQVIEAACVDALIDLDMDSLPQASHFLMEILTGEPNFVKHYTHMAFQSYYVHPFMLENMDKLRFDCFRVGYVKENMEEMEPALRHSSMFSFDLSALSNAYAPGTALSPNGLTGEEACMLTRFAGMSEKLNSFGIYGYKAEKDKDEFTAQQIGQMIWYFIDGIAKSKRESSLKDKENFIEFNTIFAEVETVFLQSKKTGRWWMKMPDEKFIACSYKDYIIASHNDIPERWLRAQERN
jgi:formiminoglutamase